MDINYIKLCLIKFLGILKSYMQKSCNQNEWNSFLNILKYIRELLMVTNFLKDLDHGFCEINVTIIV